MILTPTSYLVASKSHIFTQTPGKPAPQPPSISLFFLLPCLLCSQSHHSPLSSFHFASRPKRSQCPPPPNCISKACHRDEGRSRLSAEAAGIIHLIKGSKFGLKTWVKLIHSVLGRLLWMYQRFEGKFGNQHEEDDACVIGERERGERWWQERCHIGLVYRP